MAIPPVTLNMLQLLDGDDLYIHKDKINYNFDQILSLGGGPPGQQGLTGNQGVPGSQGIQGFQGIPGDPGTQWYVQGTTPAASPAPNVGDYWFNTATLEIFQWDGLTWVSVGTLSVAGVFKDDPNDTDRVTFTTPTAAKSLVLSPIDYEGNGVPPLAGTYKLKLIGTDAAPMMNFGLAETSTTETDVARQTYISLDKVSATEYNWSVINPSGGIFLDALGSGLHINQVAGGVSEFDFNSTMLKIQLDGSNVNMGYPASGNTGFGWMVGSQNALSTIAERALAIYDTESLNIHGGYYPRVDLRGAAGQGMGFGDFLYGDGIYFDSVHPTLNDMVLAPSNAVQLWHRWRAKIGGSTTVFMNTQLERRIDDPGSSDPRSVAIRMTGGHFTSGGFFPPQRPWHSLTWHGGSQSGTLTAHRPQLRVEVPYDSTADTLIAVDLDNNIGLGSTQFIENNNGSSSNEQFQTHLNIEGPETGTMSGLTAFKGIHFMPHNASATADRVMGITASLRDPDTTHAAVGFKRVNSGNDMELWLMTSDITTGSGGTDGSKLRYSIDANGIHRQWGMHNETSANTKRFKFVSAPDRYTNVGVNTGLHMMWAFDDNARPLTGPGMWKDIIIQQGTSFDSDDAVYDPDYHGGGFLGVGSFGVGGAQTLHEKPQTKFHVYGATTFGTRAAITDYQTDVHAYSWPETIANWTFGKDHYANSTGSLILGGEGHRIEDPANNVVVIGAHASITGFTIDSATQSNMVVIPTYLYVTTEDWDGVNEMPDLAKGGSYSVGYSTGETDFHPNTHTTDAAMRIAFLQTRDDGGNRASNGLDIIGGIENSTGPGSLGSTPLPERGYYLHCIKNDRRTPPTSTTQQTAFIVDGHNKVAIGDVPKYRPDHAGYDPDDYTTWNWSFTGTETWLNENDITLQINGATRLNGISATVDGVGAGMSLMTDRSGSSFMEDRSYRNNIDNWEPAMITTPIMGSDAYGRLFGGPLMIEPGITFQRSDGVTDMQIHGSNLVIKGGDAAVDTLVTANSGFRGGDVVIHGGRPGLGTKAGSVIYGVLGQTLTDATTDKGYGVVSLAYDWDTQIVAGGVTLGVGSPISTEYVMKVTANAPSSTATVVYGKDFLGQDITTTVRGGNSATYIVFDVEFPTEMPGDKIMTIASVDLESGEETGSPTWFNDLGKATTNVACVKTDTTYVRIIVYNTDWGVLTDDDISVSIICKCEMGA